MPGHPELVDSAMADWTCVCCNATQTSKFVSAVTQSIGEELVSLEKGSIEACQSFIRKHSQNLHPNHYYLMVIVFLDAFTLYVGYNELIFISLTLSKWWGQRIC